MTRRERLLRLLKRVGIGLAVAASVLVLVLAFLTQTVPGRAVLVRVALPYVDAALPGRIELRELARLTPSGVELRGARVFDPAGDEVIRVESLRVEISLGDILDGRIVVPEVELRSAAVDLRRIAEKRRGLMAAFVDPDAPSSPPSGKSPPYVRVGRVVVSALDVRAPEVPSIGQLDAKGLALEGNYELDQTSAAALRRFSARIERSGKPLAVIDDLTAKLERGRTPSNAKLRLTLLRRTELELAAKLVVPPEPSWKKEPASLTLNVKELTAAVLAELLQDPALEKELQGAVSAKLAAEGTLERLKGELELETAGGNLSLTANVDDFERVRTTIRCKDVHLDRLRSDLPARRVTLAVDASADAKNTEKIPVKVELRDSRIDDTALPSLTLASTITKTSTENIELAVADGRSRVEARGRAEFTGVVDANVELSVERATIEKWSRFAGVDAQAQGDVRATVAVKLDQARKLDAQGDVSIERLKAKDVEVERANASFRVKGDPRRPEGELDLRVERAKVAGNSIPKLALSANGGPSRYRLGLETELEDATVALDAAVERRDRSIGLELEAHGTLKKQPYKLAIQPTTVTFDGGIDTEGIELDLSGQELDAKGSFSKRGGTFDFETGTIDLGKISALFALDEPLRGEVALKGRLSGTPAVPNLDVTLTGERLSLGERPPLGLKLTATFNAEGGEASAKLALRAEPDARGLRRLDLALDAAHRFRPGHGFQRALADGTLLATLEIERLDSEFVSDWAKLEPLPAKGTVRGSVRAEGTRNDPSVMAELDADLLVLGAALKPKTLFHYEKGDGRLELRVDDERGRWLDLAATLDFRGAPSLDAMKERLPRVASDAAWSFTLVAGERTVTDLPGLRDAKIPATVAASVVVEHTPGAEPTGKFRVSARPTRELEKKLDERCKPSRTSMELTGELGQGRLKTTVAALDRQETLLETTVEAELALAPALAGGAPRLGKVHGDVLAERLELATLPLVCGAARGTLSAKASFDDPVGSRPELSAELSLRQFSLGGDETIDAEFRAELTHVLAKADVSLIAKEGRSTIRAQLPVEVQNGRAAIAKDAPIELDVKLERLPISPFLNPRGKLSYATGHIDGSMSARGRLRDPELEGSLVLRDVAFTATDLAQPLHGVRGTIAFTRNELVIKDFEAHDRDGVLRIDGDARLAEGERINVALDIRAKEFPIRQQGQVVATTELDAKVKAKLEPGRSDVTIDLERVDMWIESLDTRSGIALESHPDFVVDGEAPPKKETTPEDEEGAPSTRAKVQSPSEKRAAIEAASKNAKSEQSPETLLTLNAEDRVWIKRDDFAVKLQATLKTRIDSDAARVEGRVLIQRGYLMLMGKNFEIQKGSSLVFIGGKTPNPVLEITAHHLNRRSGETVSVVITGRAEKPILVFKVDDKEVSAGQAFQAIYGSQQSNQDPNAANSQAKAFVGGLTAGLLATTARRELGAAAPIIMIEPGSEANTGRVRAGFEFDSLVPNFLKDVVTGVYFEGIVAKEDTGESQQSDARTQAGFLLEFYFPRNFFTAGQYGPGPTWSMDVGWQL